MYRKEGKKENALLPLGFFVMGFENPFFGPRVPAFAYPGWNLKKNRLAENWLALTGE
jgi:hypothetical protein